MNKEEFLEILKNQLAGQMDGDEILSNLRYYSDYIDSRIGRGRTEEEVLNELGDPRLIARTLLDVEEQGGSEAAYEGVVYEESADEAGQEESEESYEDEAGYSGDGPYEEGNSPKDYGEAFSGYSDEDTSEYSWDPYVQDEGYVKGRSYHLDLSTWYGKAIVIAITCLVIAGLLLLAGLMIPVILTILGIGFVMYLLIHFFRR